VAPEIEQSAVGHAITIFRPLIVRRALKNGNFLGYAVAGTPADYGYPQKVSGAYTLAAIDVTAYASNRKSTATSLGLDFPAGSHTYQLDTLAGGQAVYTRTGVSVPAGTSIILVIK
jgi:hypothetical protein